jgi:S-formylglutathione hydrolase FrmB
MSVASIRFYSDALGKWTRYNVILPDEGEGPFPVLFQLHGLTDDCDAWLERSNLVRHVAGMPLIVALPDGGTHFYTNWRSSGRLGKANYENLIIEDMTNHLRRHFHVTEGPWAIGGLSMGGYGTLKLGLKHSNRFASIYAHSSKVDWRDSELDLSLLAEPEDINLLMHAERVNDLDRKPVISFDCGVDDELVGENRWFHAELEELGLEHRYAEFEGAHDWDYWDLHIQEALAQHAEVLGIVAGSRL